MVSLSPGGVIPKQSMNKTSFSPEQTDNAAIGNLWIAWNERLETVGIRMREDMIDFVSSGMTSQSTEKNSDKILTEIKEDESHIIFSRSQSDLSSSPQGSPTLRDKFLQKRMSAPNDG